MGKLDEREIAAKLAVMASEIHENAKAKGFHEGEVNVNEKLMLVVSELSEALEEFRNGRSISLVYYNGDNKKPEGVCVEMADAVIRLLDLMGALDCPGPHIEQRLIAGFSLKSSFIEAARGYGEKEEATEDNFKPHFPSALMEVCNILALASGQHSYDSVNSSVLPMCEAVAASFMLGSLTSEGISPNRFIDVIRQKMDYNATRPYKHGGKIV